MYQTGEDRQTRYKETSLAGLAVNVIDCEQESSTTRLLC